MAECKRCGHCCFYWDGEKVVKCKYLVRHTNGLTSCRVYYGRLGKIIGKRVDGRGVVCMMRSESFYDYKGCPLNTGKQLFEDVFKGRGRK